VNGTAIIIAHIPPGEDCLHAWGARFRALMDRYQHIVRLSLYGHTHDEAFTVVKAIEDDKNIGINYVGGSVTTWTDENPGFIVIDLDEEYLVPVNFQSYFLNITEANLGNP